MTRIEEAIMSLKERNTEPLCAYIYDLNHLRRHVSFLVSALPQQCRYYYAVKANSDREILKALAPIVHGFEVASLGEIDKVREIAPTASIIFGGPGKTNSELEGSIRCRVELIHVESIHELDRLNYIAGQMGKVVRILLRVNLRHSIPQAEMKMAGVPTQFGIDEAEIPKVLDMIHSFRHVDLQGFHFHAMSNNLDEASHLHFVRHCVQQAKSWENEHGVRSTMINVGGGIGVNYQNLNQPFRWNKLVDGLQSMAGEFHHPERTMILECGRYTTASCGYYAAEVLDIKRNHGQAFVILRGGTHHLRLPAAWKHNHPFTILRVDDWKYPFARPEIREALVTISGELCTPNDVLSRDTMVEHVRAGDIILFHYAGAYGWTISHHDFLSHPHPEHIYLVD